MSRGTARVKEYVTSLQKLCDSVFRLDSNVRFVAVYEDRYLIAGGMRPGVASYDPENDAREIDLQMYGMAKITLGWQKYFGKIRAICIPYEKLILYTFPLDKKKFLVVSTEQNISINEFTDKVLRLILR